MEVILLRKRYRQAQRLSTHLILLFYCNKLVFHSTSSLNINPRFIPHRNSYRKSTFNTPRKFTTLLRRHKSFACIPTEKEKDINVISVEKETKHSLATTKMNPVDILTPNRQSKIPKDTNSNNNHVLSSDISKIAPMNPWVDLNIPPCELRLSATLTTGQCFHWIVVDQDELDVQYSNEPCMQTSDIDEKANNSKMSTDHIQSSPLSTSSLTRKKPSAWGTFDETQWLGVLRISHDPDQCLVLTLMETPSSSWFRILYMDPMESKQNPTDFVSEFLRSYFQLHTHLDPLYNYWSTADTRLKRIAEVIPGVRVLQQDPLECLFSFLFSSNNNIPRITKLLADIRRTLGRKLLQIELHRHTDTVSYSSMDIYSFPTLSQWSTATEQSLRDLGLGYRAKYLIQSRDLLSQLGGVEFLFHLRKYNYNKTCHDYDSYVQDQLTQFSGVGKKVADCVALFSLDQTNAIPVDVHVQDIASRDYDSTILFGKSLTPTVYKQVGDLFRIRFGPFAGWAHSVLFVAELPSFRNALPMDMIEEMDQWRKLEKEKKNTLKEKKRKNKEVN